MAIEKRYEFIILFDVENGNPNGDPDAGNMPRIDTETGHGIVTDVCLKRKIRNYIELVKGNEKGFDIYVREGVALNAQHKKAYNAEGSSNDENGRRKFMCDNFYDIRTFGAVMTTGDNCGQVRGPVQINFARSIDPIVQQELTITRVTVTREEDMAKKTHEMGRKQVVPYALYRAEGYVSANLAQRVTGFNQNDLELLWEAIINMFEHDHSAARGKMATRRLFVFEHANALGNAPSHKLFELVKVERNDKSKPARSFNDYTVTVEHGGLPQNVKLIERL